MSHMGLPNNAKFYVSVGMPSSTTGDDTTVVLRVEDFDASVTLAEIKFTPLEWVNLTRGTLQQAEGFMTTKTDRIGKKMETATVMVPRDVSGYGTKDENRRFAMEWLDRQPLDTLPFSWWDEADPHATNQGWKITFRRWVDKNTLPGEED